MIRLFLFFSRNGKKPYYPFLFNENKVTARLELEGLESFSIQNLWREAGITNSIDQNQFVKTLAKKH